MNSSLLFDRWGMDVSYPLNRQTWVPNQHPVAVMVDLSDYISHTRGPAIEGWQVGRLAPTAIKQWQPWIPSLSEIQVRCVWSSAGPDLQGEAGPDLHGKKHQGGRFTHLFQHAYVTRLDGIEAGIIRSFSFKSCSKTKLKKQLHLVYSQGCCQFSQPDEIKHWLKQSLHVKLHVLLWPPETPGMLPPVTNKNQLPKVINSLGWNMIDIYG